MKLTAQNARAFLAKPDPGLAGILLFGSDDMRVALRRQALIRDLAGPDAEADMRLNRLAGAELRKDPAALIDALKAQGFFPGHRVVHVEAATDTSAPAVSAALNDWQPGDAQMVVTAGSLTARSALRKAFEAHPNAVSIGIYDDPPTRDEIERTSKDAGLSDLPREAMNDLQSLSRSLDPGDFAQTIEKLALYKLSDDTPVTGDDIAEVAPASVEAALDDALHCVAEGRAQELGPMIRKLEAQGQTPVAICIGATRHFRTLFTAASDPQGPASGIARMRPPVFGPRRDRMLRQAQGWGARKLEDALALLIETDLTLRSSSQAPQMATVERAMIRLAMMGQR